MVIITIELMINFLKMLVEGCNMRTQFKQYLIKEGYKEYTPSGHPSTVYDYIKRIDFVCEEEGLLSWMQLASNINYYVNNYDIGGRKESLGELSHRSVINALKRFRDFLHEIDYKSEISSNVEFSKQEKKASILNRPFNPRYKGLENKQQEQKCAGVGSTIVYRILEDDEINQVTLVEPTHKRFENEVSKTSDLGEALLYSKEGEEVKVNSPEPYMIRIVHISNPIYAVKIDKNSNKAEFFDDEIPAGVTLTLTAMHEMCKQIKEGKKIRNKRERNMTNIDE